MAVRPRTMSPRLRLLAPLGTFALVLAVVLTTAYLSGGRSGPGRLGQQHRPAVLRLAAGTVPLGAASSGGNGAYRLTGTLPADRPADAAVWSLRADQDSAPLRRVLGKDVAVSNGAWWWAKGCTPPPAPDSAASGCAVGSVAVAAPPVSSSGGSSAGGASATPPSPEPPAMSKDAALRAARPVFDAAHLDVARSTATTSSYGASVSLDPTVGGLETSGFTTRVELDARSQITSAAGFLATPVRGESYPLITAREAFDRLPVFPMMDLCRMAPNGKGCIAPPPPEITGAHLGLMAQQLAATRPSSGDRVLVPAWLFDVKGSDQPLAQVAISPEFLGSGSDGASDTPATTTPTTPMPNQVPPADPGATGPSRTPLSFDSAFRATTADAVVVQYGDSGSCPHLQVTHQVKEDATTVYVFLEADAQDPGKVCTADYKARRVTVSLASPLGARKVVDGSTSRAVPVS